MDVSNSTVPGLSKVLCESGTVTLRRLVDTARPDFSGVQEVVLLLGFRSARVVQRFLDLVKERMTAGEKRLLQLWSTGNRPPDPVDPFPDIHLDPNLAKDSGPLLRNTDPKMDLCRMGPKVLYKTYVKILNKRTLHNSCHIWDDKLGGQKHQWRTLYKPLTQKNPDWRSSMEDPSWRHCNKLIFVSHQS